MGANKTVIVEASCSDASDPHSLSVEQAKAAIRAAIVPSEEAEWVPIRGARGRVLASDCVSPMDVPAHTNSAMDGYAFNGADLPTDEPREYRIRATALAGQQLTEGCAAGECIRIMTGAPMPPDTDTDVMQEQVETLRDGLIRIDARHRAGQNVRLAGEDIGQGSMVFERGRRLRSADLGVLASLGFAELHVRRRPRVAFFSTGDELRSIGQKLEPGQIYDSNRYTLFAMLEESGADIFDLGVVRDDPDSLRRALEQASSIADVTITSGGVSVGEADFIKPVLDSLGDLSFWTIAMKPGRPLTFGRVGDAVFFGLPGNPVAVMLTFQQFVRPALAYLSGATWPSDLVVVARSSVALNKRAGRFEFVRGVLTYDDQGLLVVAPAGAQGSGILTSMSRANCFILLDESCGGIAAGDSVRVQPFGTEL